MDELASSTQLVLVVDDEKAIREAVRDILELAEIETVLAANGREAIELYRHYGERIKAVLLDLRMPVMSGVETYQNLRQLNESVNIILSSGYDDKVSALNTEHDHNVFFLRKPYAMDALLARIQHAMSGAQ